MRKKFRKSSSIDDHGKNHQDDDHGAVRSASQCDDPEMPSSSTPMTAVGTRLLTMSSSASRAAHIVKPPPSLTKQQSGGLESRSSTGLSVVSVSSSEKSRKHERASKSSLSLPSCEHSLDLTSDSNDCNEEATVPSRRHDGFDQECSSRIVQEQTVTTVSSHGYDGGESSEDDGIEERRRMTVRHGQSGAPPSDANEGRRASATKALIQREFAFIPLTPPSPPCSPQTRRSPRSPRRYRTSKSGFKRGSGNVGAFETNGRAFGEVPVWAPGRESSFESSSEIVLNSRGSTSTIEAMGSSDFSVEFFDPLDDSATSASEEAEIEEGNQRAENDGDCSGMTESSQEEKQNESDRCIRCTFVGYFWSFVGIFIVVIVLSIAIGRYASNNVEATPGEAAQAPCDLSDHDRFVDYEQPEILYQCECQGSVSILSPSTKEIFRTLQRQVSERLRSSSRVLKNSSHVDSLIGWNGTHCNDVRSVALFELASKGILDIQWYGLVVLFSELQVDKWTFQAHGKSTVCSWKGVDCVSDRVLKVDLAKRGLSGTIPPEVGLLTDLDVLNLASNNVLGGPIPTEIGLLSNLNYFSIDGCKLIEGTIPSEIGMVTSIEELDLDFALQLNGPIPSEVGHLSKLVSFSAESNSISGQIPSEISKLQALEILRLRGNAFSGSIPTEMDLLTDLRVLMMGDNSFEDDRIPSFLWTLTNLRVLDVSVLELRGDILGVGLANLTKLTSLDISENRLTGSLPSEIEYLTNLTAFRGYLNSFTGSLPPQIGELKGLEVLDLYSNQLQGNVPTELYQLSNLVYLNLIENSRLRGDLNPLCEITTNSTHEREFRVWEINDIEPENPNKILCSCCLTDSIGVGC